MIRSLLVFLSVFANAESLFYYARDPRSERKVLTLKEIQALFARNREQIAPDKTSSQQSSHKPNEHQVQAKDFQSEKVCQDVRCENGSVLMATTSEEPFRAANESVLVLQAVSSADEIPANRDQQDQNILSMPLSLSMKASTKIKLPPLKVQHHLNIKEERVARSLSAEFEGNSPLQKVPSDATGEVQTTEEIGPKSVDTLVHLESGTSVEATDTNGITSRETPTEVQHCDQVCVSYVQPIPPIPSSAHQGGE